MAALSASSATDLPGTPHRVRTAALVNLAAVLERCDEQMLPAVYSFIGASWSATPTQLGYITLCRALVQALSSPIGGIAGHLLHRGRVVGAGCLLWAACTATFAACGSLAAGAAVWAVNGLGLALVLPNTQSLTADLFAAAARGRAFGALYLTSALGGMLGALFATNLCATRLFGMEGWRVAFVSLAAQLSGLAAEVAAVLRIPTFRLIVAQGIAGSVPWSALAFLTLYFQLLGMSNAQASSLVALFLAGTAVGGLIGGCVGDAAAQRWPLRGRIAVTQFSVSIGIPFAFLVFKGLPRNGSPATVALYAAILLAFALLKAWPAPACNNPVFAEIVPPAQRNLVYAFDRCFERLWWAPSPNACLASAAAAAAVTRDRPTDLANAAALGNALLCFLAVPWAITLVLYTGLHWTYPADRAAALQAQQPVLRERSLGLEETGAFAAELGPAAPPEQLQQLRSACAAALAAVGPAPGAAQQKALWSAAAGLWNASIDLGAGEGAAAANAAAAAAAPAAARTRVVATLRQAACDLCTPLAPGSLLPPDQANLVRFHFKAGQAWAELEELEAAEAALSRAAEAAQALAPLCFERRGRGPHHQDAAALCFKIQLERLGVALRLGQEMLVGGLLSQVCGFAADERLPAAEGLAFCLALIRALRSHGQSLAEAGTPAAAVPLLSAAYEALSQLDLGADEAGDLSAMATEAQAMGAQVLTLLAWCYVESGEGEQALSCLQALQQVAEGPAADHYSHCFLTLRALLQLGRSGEAEAELMNLVSHEEASAEACLAGLKAALGAPGGAQLARSALSVVLERFAEEPAVAVELVRAALAQAAAAAPSAGGADGAAPMAEDDSSGGVPAAEAAEAVALEVAADDRLLESLGEEPALRRQLAALLYNHALLCLHSGRGGSAGLAFFSAALPLLGDGSDEDAPHPADCRRAQALCALAAGQHDRALEFLEAADAALPGALPTAMLRLSVHLAAGSSEGAAAAVAALADCPGAGADPLRVACCECLDAGQEGAARQALELLLLRCTEARVAAAAAGESGSSPAEGLFAPGYEATVFQNLIKLVLDSAPPQPAQPPDQDGEPGSGAAPSSSQAYAARSSELARLFDALVSRMRAVGADAFFVQQDGRHTQLEWLALQAWNAGQAAGAAGELQQAAVLMAVCGELYAALPSPSQAALHKRKLAFLMAAASACEVHEATAASNAAQQPAAAEGGARPASSGALNLARSYLAQSRAAGAALAAAQAMEGAQAGADPKSDVFAALLDFRLACLSQDTAAQLEALERSKALPAFGAEHFAMAAAVVRCCASARADAGSAGRGGSQEVCRAAEAARLQRLTQQAPMDYAAVAATLRVLLELSPSDADRLQLLGEAAGLLGAAPPGAYPAQELRWLVTTSWNRGAVHARFGRAAEAGSYQRWAAAALQHDASLVAQYQELMAAELARTGHTGAAAVGAEALAL
ncbi:MFS general substrate transporter [Chlorella sorokiniana]|uniref:MFS general substrate transporter n=1 Tax=Chlorella sorokiniana TaxID=3076 RepID=A0A2P6TZQ8_CHLSO|nr:MFS general substrate transporter [Chlorella sorokiniana]|eukprot:PRW59549.1 MFS general substrate transporter [Chlorella sorokiniana]